MIPGRFDSTGRPFIEGRVIIPRLQVNQSVPFLLDTGADFTCLHQDDAEDLDIPFEQLTDMRNSRGIGGRSAYFREAAILSFNDEGLTRLYRVNLFIAEPNRSSTGLPSLLGRNVINHWYMQYDPTIGSLDFTVRHADYTFSRQQG